MQGIVDQVLNWPAPAPEALWELGELSVGAVGDLAVWSLQGPVFAGAIADPVEAWLRCGPVFARHTVVAGRAVVRDGALVHPDLDERLAQHRRVASLMQA